MYKKMHDLWESHELLMEGVILAALLLLLGGLILFPQHVVEKEGLSFPSLSSDQEEVPLSENIEGAPSSVPNTPSSPVSAIQDTDDLRAELVQEITKANQEMKVLKDMSVSVTATIQKTCGGQTNVCAKNLQEPLIENAKKYDVAEQRLRTLTAALGNLP